MGWYHPYLALAVVELSNDKNYPKIKIIEASAVTPLVSSDGSLVPVKKIFCLLPEGIGQHLSP